VTIPISRALVLGGRIGVREEKSTDIFDNLRLEASKAVGAFNVVADLAGVAKKPGTKSFG
jgi:hypothetical protein